MPTPCATAFVTRILVPEPLLPSNLSKEAAKGLSPALCAALNTVTRRRILSSDRVNSARKHGTKAKCRHQARIDAVSSLRVRAANDRGSPTQQTIEDQKMHPLKGVRVSERSNEGKQGRNEGRRDVVTVEGCACGLVQPRYARTCPRSSPVPPTSRVILEQNSAHACAYLWDVSSFTTSVSMVSCRHHGIDESPLLSLHH